MQSAYLFQLSGKKHGQRKDIDEVWRFGTYVWELGEAKAHLRSVQSGRTCWAGMPKEEPYRIVLAPSSIEQRSALDYILQHGKSGVSGRRVKAYLVFVQTEDDGVFYIGGIYSTLKAAKDYGPLGESDFIAFYEHRGGARNIRFDRPNAGDALWGLDQ